MINVYNDIQIENSKADIKHSTDCIPWEFLRDTNSSFSCVHHSFTVLIVGTEVNYHSFTIFIVGTEVNYYPIKYKIITWNNRDKIKVSPWTDRLSDTFAFILK